MESSIKNNPAHVGVAFTADRLQEVDRLVKQYPEGRQKSALLRLLHMAEKDFGWLSAEVMDYVASLLQITPIEVYEVATFYSMYQLQPAGKYVFEFCQTGPCCTKNAEKMIQHIKNRLHIEVGETSADGIFTLKTVECLGACGYAPMMQVGDVFFEHLTEEKIDQLIEQWRNEAASKN
jgi:NADH-quinone oxidoreductase subunit E